jgi:hypothetical protein
MCAARTPCVPASRPRSREPPPPPLRGEPDGTACWETSPVRSRRLRRSGPPRPGTDRPAGHGKSDAGVEPNSRLVVGLVVDLGIWSVALDRLDAVDRAGLALIRLAGGDHLAVGGDQVEAETAVEPFLKHDLGRHVPSLGRSLLARGRFQPPYSATRKCRGPTPCIGPLRVTMTDRYVPLVTAGYGTWVARPARNDDASHRGDGPSSARG